MFASWIYHGPACLHRQLISITPFSPFLWTSHSSNFERTAPHRVVRSVISCLIVRDSNPEYVMSPLPVYAGSFPAYADFFQLKWAAFRVCMHVSSFLDPNSLTRIPKNKTGIGVFAISWKLWPTTQNIETTISSIYIQSEVMSMSKSSCLQHSFIFYYFNYVGIELGLSRGCPSPILNIWGGPNPL